jgi:hypothetical protein
VTVPCFELRYGDGEPVDTGDCVPHYRTRDEALQAAAGYAGAGRCEPAPHRLAAPCVSGVTCVICGSADDDFVSHFENAEQARRYARESGWLVGGDGTAACPGCIPTPPRT